MATRRLFAIVTGLLLLSACRAGAPATSEVPAARPSAGSAPVPAQPGASGVAPLSPPVTVKVGHTGTFIVAPIFMAKQRGYFAAEGLAIEDVVVKVSADMVPVLATGDLDVGCTAINPALFNAVSRGVDFTFVADAGTQQPGRSLTSLVVRKDLVDSGRYTRLEDLKGMTIGIPGQYVVNHYLLSVIGERHGFSLDDVMVTPVPMADSLLALRNGSLDAYYDVEPSPSIAERDGIGVRVITSDKVYEGLQSNVLLYGPSITREPETARRFMVGYLRGVRDYLAAFFEGQDRDRAIEEIRREGIAVPREVVATGLDPDARMNVASMEVLLDWWQRMGAVQQKPDVRAMVDEQYLDYAGERLGSAR
jgi:ABC-type nitrate/sulfonate/bicarbonate transport system substrate-binding protein